MDFHHIFVDHAHIQIFVRYCDRVPISAPKMSVQSLPNGKKSHREIPQN